jgi:PadR family transcriptional regulator, regulatory protein PadR
MEFGQDLVKGSIVPIVLALLKERPMYGYEIVKLVNARSGGRLEWKEGTLYPTLHRLESDGLLRSQWAEGGAAPSSERGSGDAVGGAAGATRQRKYYAITGKGRSELARRSEEWREFSTAVNRILLGGQL